MQAQDIDRIEDVLNLSGILSNHGYSDAAHTPSLIADLIDWHEGIGSTDAPDPAPTATVADKPKAKRGKATESKDSDFEPTPDPSDEPDF